MNNIHLSLINQRARFVEKQLENLPLLMIIPQWRFNGEVFLRTVRSDECELISG